MTESDEKKTRQLIQDVIGKPLAEIAGKLDLLTKSIEIIDITTKKTNGKVAEHEKSIQELREKDTKHFINCPQTSEIKEIKKSIVEIEKAESNRKAISGFTLKQITIGSIIVGLVISLVQILINK